MAKNEHKRKFLEAENDCRGVDGKGARGGTPLQSTQAQAIFVGTLASYLRQYGFPSRSPPTIQ